MKTKIPILLFLYLLPLTCMCLDDPYYTNCTTLVFNCGPIRNVTYPFSGNGRPSFCGKQGFDLVCHVDNDGDTYPVIRIGAHEFRVLNITTGRVPTVRIARTDLWDGVCLRNLTNTTLDYTFFGNSATTRNLSLFYGCYGLNRSVPYNFTCEGRGGISYYADEALLRIKLPPSERMECVEGGMTVPVLTTALDDLVAENGTLGVGEALNQGFDLVYYSERRKCSVCEASGGVCGSNLSSSDSDSDSDSEFLCLCRQGHYSDYCPIPVAGKWIWELKLKIGLGISAVVVVLIIISVFLVWRKYSQRKTKNFKNIEVFLEDFGSLCPKRFSYFEIKKITSSFKDKLGEGGFGGVYRGELQGGRPVAVKVLKGSKGDGEDFINEVSSISKTSHINVVTLLGFCFEGHKRALVYEFMPNGSLEKFIYEKSSLTSDRQLNWETLYKIAVGIARGLEYLHRGCNARILHFDIKPHNILLDEEFCPKICDFGLAKICPQKESIVSMVGARGTPGYIAPEVFSRNFGGVSHKSDVYSYGMMVLEMVGGRRNIDCGADRTSELYFPHWIYKRLELNQELGLDGITGDEEKEEARKMIIVSMWCIQTDPSNRPPMSRVVEMLEGRVASLQIPPTPFLSSPSRSPASGSLVTVDQYSSVT